MKYKKITHTYEEEKSQENVQKHPFCHRISHKTLRSIS